MKGVNGLRLCWRKKPDDVELYKQTVSRSLNFILSEQEALKVLKNDNSSSNNKNSQEYSDLLSVVFKFTFTYLYVRRYTYWDACVD